MVGIGRVNGCVRLRLVFLSQPRIQPILRTLRFEAPVSSLQQLLRLCPNANLLFFLSFFSLFFFGVHETCEDIPSCVARGVSFMSKGGMQLMRHLGCLLYYRIRAVLAVLVRYLKSSPALRGVVRKSTQQRPRHQPTSPSAHQPTSPPEPTRAHHIIIATNLVTDSIESKTS